jgi:hypothetical protein
VARDRSSATTQNRHNGWLSANVILRLSWSTRYPRASATWARSSNVGGPGG